MRLCPRCNASYPDDATFCPEDGARLSGEDGDHLIGVQLENRYLLEERIGAGGLGQVYRAKHLRMEKTFAVKLLLPSMVANEEMIKRFDREAKALSRLDHPCCVLVTDYGVSDHGPFIVMELVDGVPLSRHTRGEGLPLQVGVEVVCMVLRGLEHAHEHGIVHRDLKPDNIMLVERPLDPGRLLPKILDFGLAKIRAGFGTAGSADLTQDGLIVGTPPYMPPERVLRPTQVDDTLADIYSTGIILYELCCGRRPFVDDDVMAVIDMHLTQPPPMPGTLRPSLPEPLETAVLRSLAKTPEERFPTAAAFRDALEQLLPLPPELADERPAVRQRSTGALTKIERPDPEKIGTDATRLAPSGLNPAATTASSSSRWLLAAGAAVVVLLTILVLGLLATRKEPSKVAAPLAKKVAGQTAGSKRSTGRSIKPPGEVPHAPAQTQPDSGSRAGVPLKSRPLPPALSRATRLWKVPRHRQRAAKDFYRYLARNRRDAASHVYVGRLYLYSFWADDGVKLVRKALKIDPSLRLDTATLVALTFAYHGSSHWRARSLISSQAGDRTPVVLLASAAAMRDERIRRNLIHDAKKQGATRDPLARRLLALARARSCKARRRGLDELVGHDDPALRITLALLAKERCLSSRARGMLESLR